MLESGAVPSQDGAGRGSDGEGLAAAPHEEPQSQRQLEPALLSSPPSHPGLSGEKIIKGKHQQQRAKKKRDFLTETAPFARLFVE